MQLKSMGLDTVENILLAALKAYIHKTERCDLMIRVFGVSLGPKLFAYGYIIVLYGLSFN